LVTRFRVRAMAPSIPSVDAAKTNNTSASMRSENESQPTIINQSTSGTISIRSDVIRFGVWR
jgi:hypothetical protein